MILPLCAMQNWRFLQFDIFWKISEMKKTTVPAEELLFFNSHFPFPMLIGGRACCDSAKGRAKELENRGNDNAIGNFFDFQICTNVRAAKLKSYREKHYVSGADYFIARPYYVVPKVDRHELNAVNETYSVAHLDEWSEQFGKKKMPRSKWQMQLRSADSGEK